MAEIRDYSSIYTIKDFILNDIAPMYFDINDISLLNVGLFGMSTDIGATVAQDGFNVISRYITELLPGKATLPEFIYAEAANYGITDIFSTAASCDAMIFIKEDNIIRNGSFESGYYTYYIDSESKFYIDNVVFSLPYDIRIKANLYNDTYNYNCSYYTSNLKNSLIDFEYPYIKSFKTKINGDNTNYIGLKVKLYQYSRRVVTENIVTNNTLNIPFIDVPFEGELCNFEVIYTNSKGNETTQLIKILDNEPAQVKPFCYYRMIDDNTIRISFATKDIYFVPEYNSSLSIYIYESKGVDGNFPVYSGNNIYVAGSSSHEELDYNNTTPLFCTMVTDSQGGKSRYTLAELANLTWEAKLSLKSRSTDSDLDRYFKTYNTLSGTKSLFIKTRDDFATREYECYTRIKDQSTIFPTNTLNLEVNFDQIGGFSAEKNKYVIQPGTKIVYKTDSIDTGVITTEDKPYDIEYMSLAMINIELNPNTVVYYLNSIDQYVDVNYEYINDSALYQFILKSFHISRNAIKGEMSYNLKVVLLPSNIDALQSTIYIDDYSGNGDIDSSDPSSLFLDKMSVYIYANTYTGHYIKMNFLPDESSATTGYIFECNITTNDMIVNSTVEITNMISTVSQVENDCSIAINNPDIRILAFYDEGIQKPHDYVTKIPDTAKYTLSNIFVADDDYYIVFPLTSIRSDIEMIPTSGDPGFYLSVQNVPLFGREFIINSEKHMTTAIQELSNHHSMIQNILNNLTSSFEIHIRFFNTYGKSKVFSTDNNGNLNRTYCDIKFGIKLKNGISDECFDDIRTLIKRYIEGINTDQSTNEINVSQLIHQIYTSYSDKVDAVKFYSINGYDSSVQLITMTKDLSSKEYLDAIPEFLTINKEDITLTSL